VISMPRDEFQDAVEEAKELEKDVLPYTPYKGKIELTRTIDISPGEFADYKFSDLINLYERAGKIIKASGMEMYGVKAPQMPTIAKKEAAAKTVEIESRMKQITGEALKSAEVLGRELEKKPIEEARPKPEAGEKPFEEELELEKLAPEEFALEFEERKPRMPEKEEEKKRPEEKEIETGKKEEAPEISELELPEVEAEKEKKAEEERKPEKEIEIEKAREERKPSAVQEKVVTLQPEKPAEKPGIIKPMPPPKEERMPERPSGVPPILRERAEEAATKRFDEIEQQVMATLGEKVDEATLKKRMLDLTKELFKEKSMQRRERLKLEITVLKNMLKGEFKPVKKGMEEKEARGRLLETLLSTQMKDVAATKDKVLTDYKHQIDKLKTDFQEKVASMPEDDETGRKKAYESLVFELTSIGEKLPGLLAKYQDYLTQKHQAELRKLRGSLSKGEEKLMKESDDRQKSIEQDYTREFASAKSILKKQIDAVIESTGRVAFKPGKVQAKEAKAQDLVQEINEMDEGTLLYFLHTKDAEFYKRYERKHVSKQEAIFRAKALVARDKGLSDDMVRRYFSDTEG